MRGSQGLRPRRGGGRAYLARVLAVAIVAMLPAGHIAAGRAAAALATSRYAFVAPSPGVTDLDGAITSDDPGVTFTGTAPDPNYYNVKTGVVRIDGGLGGEFWFVGPDGAAITAGTYADATPAWQPTAGHAGMFVLGEGGSEGGSCATLSGSFTVLEVTFTSGVVTTLAVDYHQTCNGADTWGSLRFNSSIPMTGLIHEPKDLLVQDFGRPTLGNHTDKTYTYTNVGETAIHLGTAAMSGPDKADYTLPTDACSGATLAGGAACQMTIRYTPVALGYATAEMQIPVSTPEGVRTIAMTGTGSTASTLTIGAPANAYWPDPVTFTAHVSPTPGGVSPGWVTFGVDGVGWQYNGSDADGNETLTMTSAMIHPGAHTITANYTGSTGPDWLLRADAAPVQFVLGIHTAVTLVSGLNPSLSTQPVPLTAMVTAADGSTPDGGTLSITDAFDGAVLGQVAVGPGHTSLSVSPILATGSHNLTASYSGHGLYGTAAAPLAQTVAKDVAVNVSGLSVAPTTFYPIVDGYRDTTVARGTLHEPGSVVIRVYSVATGKVVRSVALPSLNGAWAWSWNGKTSSGVLQPAGTYRIQQTVADTGGNHVTSTVLVTLSLKRLYWYTASKTLLGGSYAAYLDPGDGWVSKARSSYSGGVRIASGHSVAGVAYSWTIVSATTYGTITFKVLGRTVTGPRAAIGMWNPSLGGWLNSSSYDAARLAGTAYGWYSTSASLNTHRSGRAVHALIIVADTTAPSTFDVAKVLITYRYAILR